MNISVNRNINLGRSQQDIEGALLNRRLEELYEQQNKVRDSIQDG